jgi:hypothetical protein
VSNLNQGLSNHSLQQGVPSTVPHVRKANGLQMHSEARHTQASLVHLAEQGTDAAHIADSAALIWREVDTALSPIIGQRGVAALYKRSLYLTRTAHPCLALVHEGELLPCEFNTLRATLAAQTSASAAAANGALLQTFHDLLSNLIGQSLTERLLRSVWDNPSSGDAVQDTSP